MKISKVVLLTSVAFLFGCANQMTLTYSTQPQGAILSYSDGSQQIGVTPAAVVYNWDTRFVKNGCLQTKGVTATWSSGAKASSPEIITICGKSGNYTYSLSRPANVEGIEKDRQIAQEVESRRAIQQQTAIARQQSTYQMIQMFDSMQPKSTTTTGTAWNNSGNSVNYSETTR